MTLPLTPGQRDTRSKRNVQIKNDDPPLPDIDDGVHYRQATSSLDGPHSDEVLISEHRVIWKRNGSVCRIFKATDRGEIVSHAVLTNFVTERLHSLNHTPKDTSDNTRTALAVVVERNLHLLTNDGSNRTITLPGKVSSLFACGDGGLVLQLELIRLAPSLLTTNELDSRLQFNPDRTVSKPTCYCLTDLHGDLGLVGLSNARNQHSTDRVKLLPAKEKLVHVWAKVPSRRVKRTNAVTATTCNTATGRITIWKIRRLQPREYNQRESPGAKSSSKKHDPTRTSDLDALASKFRQDASMNDHAGLLQSFRRGPEARGTTTLSAFEDLAFDLERDIEPVGAQTRSSRRISSMLARSDLTSAKDRHQFNEVSTLRGSRKSFSKQLRREGSVVSLTARESTDGRLSLRAGSFASYTTSRLSVLGKSHDPADIARLDDDLYMEPEDHQTIGLTFQKLRSFEMSAVSRSSTWPPITVEVLEYPWRQDSASSHREQQAVCILELDSHALTMVILSAKLQEHNSNESAVTSDIAVKATRIHTASSISQIKLLEDKYVQRLLVVSENSLGEEALSLEAPWSPSYRIEVSRSVPRSPASTARSHRNFEDIATDHQHKDLLYSPGTASSLAHTERLDRNEISGSMTPRNGSVAALLQLFSFVLPAKFQSSLTVAYWEVSKWLRQRGSCECADWTVLTLIVLIMVIPYISRLKDRTSLSFRRSKATTVQTGDQRSLQSSSLEEMLQGHPTHLTSESYHGTDNHNMSSHGLSRTHDVSVASFLTTRLELCIDLLQSPTGDQLVGSEGYLPTAINQDRETRGTSLAMLLVVMFMIREDLRCQAVCNESTDNARILTALIAQLANWFKWPDWSFPGSQYFANDEPSTIWLAPDEMRIDELDIPTQPFPPINVFEYTESYLLGRPRKLCTVLELVDRPHDDTSHHDFILKATSLLPNFSAIQQYLGALPVIGDPSSRIAILKRLHPSLSRLLATQAPINSDLLVIPTTRTSRTAERLNPSEDAQQGNPSHLAIRDVHSACHLAINADNASKHENITTTGPQIRSKLIFSHDRRLQDAARILNQTRTPEVELNTARGWSEADLLEAQKLVAQYAVFRTYALPPGHSLMHYNTRSPLLTERIHAPHFSIQCIVRSKADADGQPMTVTVDRNQFTEDKSAWAWFHNGVSSGLMISKDAKWIDTSWILYNKPAELTNRHAGLLLALGLNGHLKSLAKWVAFKYLTPKHTMTSIGLLLGLAASSLGTADILITRLLSVHIACLLPVGAAELNLSAETQTTGLAGIGLLYYNTEHRRMSEVMLSEIENQDSEELNGDDPALRDESYRLAAGMAFGMINLGRGGTLRSLHDMRITERLLAVSVATKNVNLVHVLDRATAGAVVALMLTFLQTSNKSIAKQIDVPDTAHQFDYVRADIFLLRTLARHLIMWDAIQPTNDFIRQSLPKHFAHRANLAKVKHLVTRDLPLYHIIAGICFAISLRYAGTQDEQVRDMLISYLDHFIRLCRLTAINYDARVTLDGLRNCLDVVAIASAIVMAGSGDLVVFRRLRSLHGRTDKNTTWGSHMAAHMAIGALFLCGGTATFGRSKLAIAALVMSFYPSFPSDFQDNKGHLQALRHLWVLAVEHRCLTCVDTDTNQAITDTQATVEMRDGTEKLLRAPCLLPDLDLVLKLTVRSAGYVGVVLDMDAIAHQSTIVAPRLQPTTYREAFKKSTQGVRVELRHQALYDKSDRDGFMSEMDTINQQLNSAENSLTGLAMNATLSPDIINSHVKLGWIWELPTFNSLTYAERELLFSETNHQSENHDFLQTSIVDEKLEISNTVMRFREQGRLQSDDQQMASKLWLIRLLLVEYDHHELVAKRMDILQNRKVERRFEASFMEDLRQQLWSAS